VLGAAAVGVVLLVGRLLLRPLFQEIARSRLRELFTLAVAVVVLSSAWGPTRRAFAGTRGFLAGMMLAETEIPASDRNRSSVRSRHPAGACSFITVGMLLDVRGCW